MIFIFGAGNCIYASTSCLVYKNQKPFDLTEYRPVTQPIIFTMQSTKNCQCSISERSPSCFSETHKYERAVMMETELKTCPRVFESKQMSEEPASLESESEDDLRRYMPKNLEVQKNDVIRKIKRGLVEDTSMIEKNRNSLNRFESLSIQGQTLTGISIGGYELDLSKAAEKTMEIIPLPPSKLPIIFTDESLNFYHHFFQGMTKLLGQTSVDFIVRSDIHYEDDDPILIPLVEELISSGYEKSDTESTLLIKKVMASTFEPVEYRSRSVNGPSLKIVANIWGFQYIECGMQMAEVDMKMWFSMCYGHYKTSWFNTFKTTGIPSFAHHGTQRHRSSGSSTSTMPRLLEYPTDNEGTKDVISQRGHRKKKSSVRSVRSGNIQGELDRSYSVAKWLSGKN